VVSSWPDELYEQASEPVALACLELLSDEDRWIHRRVETIDLLAQELVRRQVTVEFTLPEPLHAELRVGPQGPWCVPVAILADDTSAYFAATFAESYMLVALLAQPHGRRILKYAYDEHLASVGGRAGRARRIARRLGWSPLVIDIDVPTAAHAASYHAEVVVPEELRLDAFVLDAWSGELLTTDIERGVDRASLHAPSVPLRADPVLTTAISAERSGVPTLALVISAVTSLLLVLGASVARLDSPTAGSSVAVLLAGSALFAAAVARGHEHRLVRGIFAAPRWLLSIVAVAALAAGASVAFGADPGVRDGVWYCAFAASGLSCLGLAVACWRAAPLTRRPARGADEDLRR